MIIEDYNEKQTIGDEGYISMVDSRNLFCGQTSDLKTKSHNLNWPGLLPGFIQVQSFHKLIISGDVVCGITEYSKILCWSQDSEAIEKIAEAL